MQASTLLLEALQKVRLMLTLLTSGPSHQSGSSQVKGRRCSSMTSAVRTPKSSLNKCFDVLTVVVAMDREYQ